jgi:putative ABC transport system permease protein
MTGHLLKLIWNRKRTNLLLMAEILGSFLVVFGVTTMGLYLLDNYRSPLGYVYQDVWRISIDTKASGPEEKSEQSRERVRRLLQAVRDLPEVATATASFVSPYDSGGWTSGYSVDGRKYQYWINSVTDEFKDALGLEIVQGRWFSAEDDAATGFKPVVINQTFARYTFGGEDALGRAIPQEKARDGQPRSERRVVGVVREFRQHGEYAARENYLFERMRLTDPKQTLPRMLLIKVRPGTGAAFEERLMAGLQAVARDWSFKVEYLDELRAANHRERLAPVLAVGTVAGFLLLMVALGLTGVLWQNVTQRTREIGLRRAKGATAQRIHRQILGEVVVMTSMAMALGVLIVVQFPLLDLLGFVSKGVFALSLAVSAAALYVLTVLCGFYPARLATRVQPAEALHYE